VVSITSDAMPRITVGFMYTPPLSFDQVNPSRMDPLDPQIYDSRREDAVGSGYAR
jgi:hypothetical protein